MKERKLTRDEKRERKSLEKAFHEAHKQQAKLDGWSYIKPTAFKKFGEWFVVLHPVIWTDAERAQLQATVKPFAIDDLISRVLGFDGLDGSPMSLRARGPHALVTPLWTQDIEASGDLDKMMALATQFSAEIELKISSLSLDDFIDAISDGYPEGKVDYNKVAALMMADRLEEALALCELAIASKQAGGPSRLTEGGQVVSFFELARRFLHLQEPNLH